MRISWRNSKKCSTAETALLVAGLFSAFLCASAQASVAPNLSLKLQLELKSRSRTSFTALLRHWEQDYGIQAVEPLLQIAKNGKTQDADRYVALMGASKIGGQANARAVVPFLKDSSWMIRSGALQALALLKNPETASSVLPLLDDKALVVRVQAVEAVRALKPKGAEDALAATASKAVNFHGGKAQWVPEHALNALVALKAAAAAPKLAPLLDKSSDPGIQRKTIETLQLLTGKSVRKDLPLLAQAQEWKRILAAK